MMKKITFLLSLFMIGFLANETFAQHSFTTVAGPTLVVEGSPVTLNINDAGNTLDPAPVSSTGSYSSFSVSVEWADDNNAWSSEADLTLTTTAGSVVIDPATTGSANSGNATTLTFEGDFIAPYVPGTDGFLDITLNQSWTGSSASWSNITVTIFESPSCIDPDTFVTTNVTTTSVDLSWNDPSGTQFDFEYVIQPQGTGMPAGAGTPISDFTVTDGTLSAATAYEAWVRADCGVNGFSNWVGPLNFVTPCTTVTDFIQNFDGVTTPAFPICWSKVGASGAANTQTTNPSSAPNTMYIYSSSTTNLAVVAMPPVSNLGDGTHRLRFDMRANFTVGGNIEIGYLTNPSDATSFVALTTVTAASTTYQQYIVTPPAGMYSDYPAFRHTGSPANSVLIDNVVWEVLPSCVEPDTFAFNNLTDTSVDLSWNDPTGTQFDFEYVIQPQGTGMPAGAGTPISDFTVTDGTLSATTAYEAWVRASCGGGDFSGWVGPLNFTTACSVFTVPSLEDFTTYVPACWEEADNGDLVAGPATFGTSSWVADGFGNAGSTGSARIEIWLATLNDWIISPTYAIPATGYELKFDAATTQWNTTGAPTTPWEADDVVEVLISTTGTTNWTVLYTYNNSNVPAPTGTTNIIDLDAYAGQNVRFAFRALEGAVDGSADLNFYVDNFEIRLTPSCIEPNLFTASNVTASSVDLTWNDPSGIQFDFEYVIQPQGTGMPAGAGTPISDFTVTDGTLSAATAYEAWVRADCGGDYSAWVGPLNFSTSIEVICGTPVNTTYCYTNNDTTSWTFTSNDGSPLRVTFNAGQVEVNWDELIVFDSDGVTELYNGYGASGNIAGLTFDSTGDTITIQITSDGSASCQSSGYTPWDFDVVCATCVNPTATFTVVPDCVNAQFSVEVDLTALGTATSVTISDGTTDLTGISATGVQTFGPYADGASVTIDVTNEQDNSCTISSGALTNVCPPANDDCANAFVVTMPYTFTQDASAATNNAGFITSCANTMNDGVWYTVVGDGGDITIDVINVTGWDPQVDVYTGSCGAFTCVGSADVGGTGFSEQYTIIGSSVGVTYYINIGYWSGFTDDPEGPFTINVSTTLSSNTFDSNSFVAYPNPVKDVLTLEYTSDISSVRVLNMLGQEVLTRTVNAASAQVDMSQLAAGTYLVNVTSGDVQKTIKVVKQ